MKNLLYIITALILFTSCGDSSTHYSGDRSTNAQGGDMDHVADEAQIKMKQDSMVYSDTVNAENPARGGDRGGMRTLEGNPNQTDQYGEHRDTSYMNSEQDVTLDKDLRKRDN